MTSHQTIFWKVLIYVRKVSFILSVHLVPDALKEGENLYRGESYCVLFTGVSIIHGDFVQETKKTGLHENVIVLDYDNEYASLRVRSYIARNVYEFLRQ